MTNVPSFSKSRGVPPVHAAIHAASPNALIAPVPLGPAPSKPLPVNKLPAWSKAIPEEAPPMPLMTTGLSGLPRSALAVLARGVAALVVVHSMVFLPFRSPAILYAWVLVLGCVSIPEGEGAVIGDR